MESRSSVFNQRGPGCRFVYRGCWNYYEMPVGMQETNFARSSSHILPTVLGPRQMTTYQRVMKYGTSAAIKDGPAPVGAFVLGWSAFVLRWHVVWIMLMAPAFPLPSIVRVSFITFWLFDRLLSVVSVSALISVSCNYSLSGRFHALETNVLNFLKKKSNEEKYFISILMFNLLLFYGAQHYIFKWNTHIFPQCTGSVLKAKSKLLITSTVSKDLLFWLLFIMYAMHRDFNKSFATI